MLHLYCISYYETFNLRIVYNYNDNNFSVKKSVVASFYLTSFSKDQIISFKILTINKVLSFEISSEATLSLIIASSKKQSLLEIPGHLPGNT